MAYRNDKFGGGGYGANSNGYGGGNGNGGGNRGYGQSNGFSGGGGNRSSGRWEMNGSSLSKPRWDSVATVEKNFYKEHEAVQKRPMEEIQNFLNKNEIKVKGTDVPRPIFNFNESGFPDTITKYLYKSFQSPTIIQSVSWPVAMSGRNLVGIAQTGSGKTLAFLLPGILHISKQPPVQRGEGPIALILCPTRELAIQVQEVCSEYGQVAGLRSVCVYGGAPKGPQDSALRRGCEICIATPGRLIDFMESRVINLARCTYLVLDEADRMLDMGFEPQIRKVIEQIQPERQLLLYSATWPKEVQNLAEDYLNDYMQVNIGSYELAANRNITQIVECCQAYDKDAKLINLLKQVTEDGDPKTLIFTETKRKADELTRYLRREGWPALCIHGDKQQNEREWVLNEFKCGKSPILIATDVAARGLDVDDIKYVINYDFPQSSEDYVHRIGRTGRRDRKGTAYTFFTHNNSKNAADLLKILQEAGQEVPHELYEMVEVARHIRPRNRYRNKDDNSAPKNTRKRFNDDDSAGYSANKRGHFDENRGGGSSRGFGGGSGFGGRGGGGRGSGSGAGGRGGARGAANSNRGWHF